MFQILKGKWVQADIVANNSPAINEDGIIQIQPQAILEHRMVKRNNQALTEALAQWENTSVKDGTWENYINFKSDSQNFNLEGKVDA